jgi:hypothetical protein
MTLVPSDVTDRAIEEDEGPSGPSSWIPRWLRRQREADDLAQWASQVARQWTDAMDSARLAEHGQSAAKLPLTVAPQVESVDPGPPMTMLVRMLPGQSIAEFQEKAQVIATVMQVSAVEITPFDDGLINVALLDHDMYSEVAPPQE